MKNPIRAVVRKVLYQTGLLTAVRACLRPMRDRQTVSNWVARGRPVPPPHQIKQSVIKKYAKDWGTRILIETGTLHGDMLEALKRSFDRLYSIELQPEFVAKARIRFCRDSRITIIEGDSGSALKPLIQTIHEPVLLWLDGHYSGGNTAKGEVDTPIVAELAAILNPSLPKHVILIDDARLFGEGKDYPTIDEIRRLVTTLAPDRTIDIVDDIIRIVPHSNRVI